MDLSRRQLLAAAGGGSARRPPAGARQARLAAPGPRGPRARGGPRDHPGARWPGRTAPTTSRSRPSATTGAAAARRWPSQRSWRGPTSDARSGSSRSSGTSATTATSAGRFDDVFARPMGPLLDAGVGFELAIGNHDADLHHSEEGLEEIEAELRLLGTPEPVLQDDPRARPTSSTSTPACRRSSGRVPPSSGNGSTTRWRHPRTSGRSCCCTIPLYSSGRHGSTPGAREALEPILSRRHVDLVLAGHDHHYERTRPDRGHHARGQRRGLQDHRGRAAALHGRGRVDPAVRPRRDPGRPADGSCIRPDGSIADRFELRAREGR